MPYTAKDGPAGVPRRRPCTNPNRKTSTRPPLGAFTHVHLSMCICFRYSNHVLPLLLVEKRMRSADAEMDRKLLTHWDKDRARRALLLLRGPRHSEQLEQLAERARVGRHDARTPTRCSPGNACLACLCWRRHHFLPAQPIFDDIHPEKHYPVRRKHRWAHSLVLPCGRPRRCDLDNAGRDFFEFIPASYSPTVPSSVSFQVPANCGTWCGSRGACKFG